jgi:peptidyl-dipeptidase Dcp
MKRVHVSALIFGLFLSAGVSCSRSVSPTTSPQAAPGASANARAAAGSHANPFSAPSTLPFGAPRFDRIATGDFEPAFEDGMKLRLAEMNAIASQSSEPTFDNTIVAMERAGQMLGRVQRVFSALQQANTNDSLQAIQRRMAPRFAANTD